MLARFSPLVVVMGALCAVPKPASACSGPCATPELWDIDLSGSNPTVVTNFGLIRFTETGFVLACEEAIGGLLLDARFDRDTAILSTSRGVFRTASSACAFEVGPALPVGDYLLDLDLIGGETPRLFGLVTNPDGGAIHVLLQREAADFEILATLDPGTAFQDIRAAFDPAVIYVTGYSFMPRTFQLAVSRDGGREWATVTPAVDNEGSTLRPVAILPNGRLLLFANTGVERPDEVLGFDLETGSVELVLRLENEADFGGLAVDGGRVFVASRRADGGSVYVADLAELAFEQTTSSAPPLSCLRAAEGVLYGCVSDFSTASPFLLGRSEDEGRSFAGLLHLGDLGRIDACSEQCAVTSEWLHATYGLVPLPDAGTTAPVPVAEDEDREAATRGCTCRLAPSTRANDFGNYGFGILLLLAALRRSRPAPLLGSFTRKTSLRAH